MEGGRRTGTNTDAISRSTRGTCPIPAQACVDSRHLGNVFLSDKCDTIRITDLWRRRRLLRAISEYPRRVTGVNPTARYWTDRDRLHRLAASWWCGPVRIGHERPTRSGAVPGPAKVTRGCDDLSDRIADGIRQ